MPRKNKEEYNEYMNDYMKNKSRKKDNSVKKEDFDGTQSAINMNDPTTKEFIKLGKEALKDPITGETDVWVDRLIKLAPIGIQLVKGFTDAMKQNQQQLFQMQQQQQPMKTGIQPPIGWVGMSPVQRISRKYSHPDWYQQGCNWEEQKGNHPQQQQQQQQIEYQPPTSRIPQQPQQPQQPQNLNDLANKYPDPPLVTDNPPIEHQPIETKEETNKETEMIVNALKEDNEKYLSMGIKFMSDMKLDDFKNYIKDIDKLIEKYKPMMWLIPIQLKELLKNTSSDELIEIFKKNAKPKYDYLVRVKKVERLKELFEKLQGEL